MYRGFWDTLPTPIIGLSPMDGVTDAAYRCIADKYGKPDILLSEFIPVEGITRGAVKLLSAFKYHKTDTPNVAQIYGVEVPAFYKAAFIVAEMGFDGIDINMGCPAHNVSRRGAGAGLIRTPDIAKEIVRQTQKGVEDWANGRSIEEVGVPPKIIRWIREYLVAYGHGIDADGNPVLPDTPVDQARVPRRMVPVSVKTRIGFDVPVVREWISHLLEVEPANISLHGRTLKQMYTGLADWEQIAIAAQTVMGTGTSLLGNGDVHSRDEALQKVQQYGVDGVLIGRASLGNPWIFSGKEVDAKTKLRTALEHAQTFETMTPELNFMSLRKHMAWYCRGFDHAAEFRQKLMMIKDSKELEVLLSGMI